jgi:hypothetical protein
MSQLSLGQITELHRLVSIVADPVNKFSIVVFDNNGCIVMECAVCNFFFDQKNEYVTTEYGQKMHVVGSEIIITAKHVGSDPMPVLYLKDTENG